MANEDKPVVTMDINQDPYRLLGQLGISSGAGAQPRIDISNVIGADVTRFNGLSLPQILKLLTGPYDRDGSRWIYRPFGSRSHTQGGTLSDIQAGLCTRFQEDQEEINRLLSLLSPLIPDADEDDCNSTVALARARLDDIVGEACRPGGPMGIRVDAAFQQWIGIRRQLMNTFGLDDINIKTAADAEVLAHFVMIDARFESMKATYDKLKIYLDRSGDESFGNQVIWLGRALNTVKETIVRLQFMLRARFVGMEELATKIIPNDNITVAELLQWTAEVCDKGSVISTNAGRDGMRSLAGDLYQLQNIYDNDLDGKSVGILELDDPPVQQTIDDIVEALGDAATYADPTGTYGKASAAKLLPAPLNVQFGKQVGKAGSAFDLFVFGNKSQPKKAAKWKLQFTSKTGEVTDLALVGQPTKLGPNVIQFKLKIDPKAKAEPHELRILENGTPIWESGQVFTVTK